MKWNVGCKPYKEQCTARIIQNWLHSKSNVWSRKFASCHLLFAVCADSAKIVAWTEAQYHKYKPDFFNRKIGSWILPKCFSGISTVSFKKGYIANITTKINFRWSDISALFMGDSSHSMAGSDWRKILTNTVSLFTKSRFNFSGLFHVISLRG